MAEVAKGSGGRALGVLYPVFALTGVVHVLAGPLMPSLAACYHLDDNQSGLLFLLYYGGSSLGALLCRGSYALSTTFGFLGIAVCCVALGMTDFALLYPLFLLLGISVGAAMTGVSLYTGRNFPTRCAPLLTSLNFVWSAGALLAPLFAARILVHHSYRAAYLVLALPAAIAAISSWLLLEDAPEAAAAPIDHGTFADTRLILVFALAAFLQVGVENIASAWLSTYSLRVAGNGVVMAAAATALFWFGFLASRGLSSLLLLQVRPMRVFRAAVVAAIGAGILLTAAPWATARNLAMLLLGASLAPIYPLVLARFFARARHTSQSRWVMATAGFGGSVLPWIAGWNSTHTGSLRIAMIAIPVAMALMALLLPTIGKGQEPSIAK